MPKWQRNAAGGRGVLGSVPPEERGEVTERVGTRSRLAWSRLAVAVAMLGVMLSPLAGQATHAQGGSVLLGALGIGTCSNSPDCIAWRLAGCKNDATAVRGNAIWSSIANVADVAGTTRTITISLGSPGLAYTGVGGANVEFFRAVCTLEVQPSPPLPTIRPGQSVTFTVPSTAVWMTVSGGHVVNLRWTMR